MLPEVVLVLGGAASGKSTLAERIVRAQGARRLYVATATPFDVEMQRKINAHRQARSGDGWRTVEAPEALPQALRARLHDDVTLVDCVTLWLSNRLLGEADPPADRADLLAALEAPGGPVTIVSNEVGLGVVPDTSLGRRFREAQGALNAALAARADAAILVTAGLPLVLKGAMPRLAP